MKTVARIVLAPGMILGEDVYTNSGEKLYSQGTKLDSRAIERIARYNIMAVTVMEDIDFAKTHTERVKLSDSFKSFKKTYYECVLEFRNIIDAMVTRKTPPPMDKLMGIYLKLASGCKTGEILLDYLVNIPADIDNMVYEHMLNSALIASVFATWMGMSKVEMFTLIQCGFLYDVGKFRLPMELLYKPSKLTDFEFETIKTHTLLGHDLIVECGLNQAIAKAALMHHEKVDGSGYPSKLKLEKIDSYAQYIAIIDAYEAMSAPKTYRHPLNPFEIIANFEKDGFTKYDTDKLNNILFHIAQTQMGLTAKLNDGREGDILLINSTKISRPLLKAADGALIDLSAEPSSVKIVALY